MAIFNVVCFAKVTETQTQTQLDLFIVKAVSAVNKITLGFSKDFKLKKLQFYIKATNTTL